MTPPLFEERQTTHYGRNHATVERKSEMAESLHATPAGGTAQTGPALLAYNAAAAHTERQMQWWGQANGYTHLLRKYLDGPAVTGDDAKQFDTGWSNVWQTAACLRPLHGRDAVALKKPLPTVTRLQPADFALRPSSKAARWSSGTPSLVTGGVRAILSSVRIAIRC